MGNSQLQPAHFNKRRHHSKKRGGDGEAVAQGEQAQGAAPAAQGEQAQAPAAPAAQDPGLLGNIKGLLGNADQGLQNKQEDLTNAAKAQTAKVQGAFKDGVGNLADKLNNFVGNAPAAEAAPAAPAAGGGRRKRTKRRTAKRTKRRTHKRSSHKRRIAKRK